MTKNILTAAVAAVISLPGHADPKIEDEIIVTATKGMQSLKATLPTAHVINSIDIERMQPRDLPSLLGRVSGVSFRDSGGRGSTSGVFIRGAASSQIIVLIDGVRSASATTGATALENIPVESIERIEIVKGPLSGLYGADAMGGVIQVFTKRGQTSGVAGSARANYGTHRTQDYGISVSGGNDNVQFYGSVSKEDTAGIDRTDLSSAGNGDRDGFEEHSGSLSLSAQFNERLSAQLNYLKSDSRSDFDNVYGTDTGRYSDSTVENVSSKVLFNPSDVVSLSVDLGYFSDHLVTPAFSSDIQTRRRSIALQGDVRLSGASVVTFGADYYDDDVTTLSAFAETERDNEGYFVQWQGRVGHASVVTSLRYDDNEAYGDDTNGSFSLGYPLSGSVQLVASYGTAFKAPTFNDLFFPGYGNPNVLPEESETFELALKGYMDDVDWRLSLYRSNVDDLIGYDFSTFTAGNTKNATLEGVELALQTTLWGWNVSSNLDYLEARDADSNEYLDDRAVWTANLSAGRGFGNLYVSVDAKAEHGRHDRSGSDVGGFAVWGLSAVYDVAENVKVSARVDNLFDKNYTLNLATSNVSYETEGTVAKFGVEYTFK